MKTTEEFERFFENKLRAEVEELARQHEAKELILKRQDAKTCAIIAGITVFAGVVASAIICIVTGAMAPAVFVGGFCFIIGFAICVVKGTDDLTSYRVAVIRRIVEFVDPKLVYKPKKRIGYRTFIASSIFEKKPSSYRGHDFVAGRIGQVDIRFSTIQAGGTGFAGIFFVGDFNKRLKTQTVVVPDNAEQLFGRFGRRLQPLNATGGDLVELEDIEFEKYFAVYSGDPIEARYVLSPSLMQRITSFHNKIADDIYLSFKGSKVYVCIACGDRMGSYSGESLLGTGWIMEYYEYLQLMLGVVENLDLNTRIWSKL